MSCYHAEIINLSLKDDNILKQFSILHLKKRFWGYVKIYTISIPEKDIEETIRMFQKSMGTKLNKEWYITFHNAEQVIILFRKRVFYLSGKGIVPVYQKMLDTLNAKGKEQWDEMIDYAKSLGIPHDQCDFLPVGFDKQVY
ncbi:hypothetical protein V6615_12315 [Oscillospiraceae bacterium PP1C4]